MFNSRMFKRTIIETPTHQTGRSAMGPNPRNLRGRAKCAVLGFTAMIVLLTASPAFGGVAAPTTASLNYETAVGSGFNSPYATAVDKSGNVFVADVLGNKVYEIVAVNGTVSASSTVKPLGSFTSARSVAIAPNGDLYVSAVINYSYVIEKIALSSDSSVSTFSTALSNPRGMVFDASGDLFVADSSSYVYEFVATSGVISGSATPLQVGSGYSSPQGVALDASGDVFIGIGGTGSSCVYEVLASASGFSSSSVTNAVGSGFSYPTGVAIDSAGNLFVSDMMGGKIYEIAASDNFSTSSAVTTVRSGLTSTPPALLSADGNGNIFVATQNSASLIEISTKSANLGSVNVGLNTSVTLTFQTNDTSTLSFNVLTNGAESQDYTSGSAPSCFTSYSIQYCTVNVVFTPQYAGTRNGAVIVKDSTGAAIFTANLTGTGLAAQISFLPGTMSAALNSSSLDAVDDIAIDNNGNIFVAYESTSLCELPAGSSICTSIGSFVRAYSVAIDGAGNLYVADDSTAPSIYKLTLENGSYAQSEIGSGSGYSEFTGVAVDASGNVYVADVLKGVFKLTPTASGYLQSTVSTVSTGPDCPWGLTVDGSGNIFVANNSCGDGGAVYKLTPTGGGYAATTLGSNWSDPNGIKVDAAGNVYVADDDNNDVVILAPSTTNGVTTYTPTTAIPSSIGLDPEGLALDGKGNLYVVESDSNNVYKFDYATPPTLNFGSVNLGHSSAVQTVTVTNIGNAALDISAVSYPSNFPNSSDGTTDCTSSSVLTAAEFCTLSADFSPVLSGANSGSIVLTDNALNATAAKQSISVSGTGSTPSTPATLTTPTPGSTLSTSSVTFTWTTGTGATEYALSVGDISKGSYNLYRSPTLRNTTSVSVSLPINGETLYVTLSSFIGSAWQSNYYTYSTSGTPVLAALTSPAPGSTLTSSSATFQWSAGSGVSGYILALSATNPGSHDLYSGTSTTATSASVTGLPVNGLPIYARLYSHINGSWAQYIDYVYNPATAATLASPTQGTALAATGQVFTWAPVTGATGYTLYLGTSAGGGNLLDAHTTATTFTAGNLPANGGTIYARLWTNFNGTWKYTDSTFTAAAPAALTSPGEGTTLAATGQVFTWAQVTGATGYTFYLGTSQGAGNLLDAHTTATTVTAGKLPTGTVWVRLWTNINGVWTYTDSNFLAQ